MSRYDVIVAGSGPAGLEAAINLRIRQKSFLLFGNPELSKKITLAPRVDNYLGLPSVTGAELSAAFSGHLKKMEIEITHEMIRSIYPMGDYFAVATGHNTYEATSVILATGVSPASLFDGEERLLGRGVGYCATCDAPLYRGKRVAVIGYGDDAVREANFIAELVAKTWYIPMGKANLPLRDSIEVVEEGVEEIEGEGRVSHLRLQGRRLETDGVFILRDTISPASLLPGIEVRDGSIAVDAAMSTNIPGCFAAGDCTGRPHQYIRAAGQGLIAAHSAVEYVDTAARKDQKTKEE